ATSDSTDNVATATATLDLVPGDYVLTVVAPDDKTPSYSFRIFDLTQASGLTFNTGGMAAVTGQLSPANETDLYSFTAAAGERFYFDFVSLSASTGSSATWRLLDPFGGTVFGPTTLNADAGLLTLPFSGAYTLLVEGTIGAASTTRKSVNEQKVSDDSTPLVFGTTVTGTLGHAGQRDGYTFSLQ